MIMLKKLISVILGLAMVFSMSIGVSAEISESFEEQVDNDLTVLADEHSVTVEDVCTCERNYSHVHTF